MSAEQEHSATPWKASCRKSDGGGWKSPTLYVEIVAGGGKTLVAYFDTASCEYPSDDECKANAERIVACVNFCAGMSTRELVVATERGNGLIGFIEHTSKTLVQRDRLLADIRYAVQFFEHARSVEELAVIRKRLLAGIEACEPCRHSTMPLRNGGGKCMKCGDIIEDQP